MVTILTTSLPGTESHLAQLVTESNSAQSMRPTFSGWGPRI
jgi:hypothetical protein